MIDERWSTMDSYLATIQKVQEILTQESWEDDNVDFIVNVIREGDKITNHVLLRSLSERHTPLIEKLAERESIFHCFPQESSFWYHVLKTIPFFRQHVLKRAADTSSVCCASHCCCSNWKVLLMLHAATETETSKIIGKFCIHEKSCCLDACLTFLDTHSNTAKVIELLDSIRPILPSGASTFIGSTSSGTHSVVRKFILLEIKTKQGFDHNLLPVGDDPDKELIHIFTEQDDQLLQLLYEWSKCLIDKEHESNKRIHRLLQLFFDSIKFDEGVLIDWLSTDADTCVFLLKLLLLYLKCDQTGMDNSSREMLIRLGNKVSQLGSLLPFDSSPLLRLLPKGV